MYCKHCGKEIDDNSTFCKHCGKQLEKAPIKIQETNNNKTITAVQEKENSPSCLIATIIAIAIIAVLITVIVFVMGTGIVKPSDIQLKKQPPELGRETTQTLTKIIINVYCPENYKTVEVTIQLYDENDTVIGTHILQGQNYKKGNTYELIYEPTMTELWYAKYIKYSVTDYK